MTAVGQVGPGRGDCSQSGGRGGGGCAFPTCARGAGGRCCLAELCYRLGLGVWSTLCSQPRGCSRTLISPARRGRGRVLGVTGVTVIPWCLCWAQLAWGSVVSWALWQGFSHGRIWCGKRRRPLPRVTPCPPHSVSSLVVLSCGRCGSGSRRCVLCPCWGYLCSLFPGSELD